MQVRLFLALILFVTTSCSSDGIKNERSVEFDKVPKAISEAFEIRHPGMKTNFHLQEINGDQSYEAHFLVNQKSTSERYASDGKLIETEREILWSDLSGKIASKIQDYLSNHDSEYSVLNIQEVKSRDFNGYECRVRTKESRTHLMEYFFNADGSFHHQEEIKLVSIPTLN